ncbi:MAG: hypothetical protein ACXWJN_09815 [Methyloceanibacter sp.]
MGIILGALLTVGAAFVADSLTPGDSASIAEHRSIVNWDVAEERFHALVTYTREEWVKLAH